MRGVLERFRRGVRHYGVVGSLRRAASIARAVVYFRERHVWYELDLDADRPRPQLPGGFGLLRAGEAELPVPESLWAIPTSEARRRLGDEGQLWLVRKGMEPAFSCWTFRLRTPVRAARGGWLELPEGTVCLEESMTAAAFRGHGVAPAAWAEIADRLAAEGVPRMVTTIEERNIASRRAVEKIGFREIATSTLVKRGPSTHVVVQPRDVAAAAFLEQRLAR